MKIKGHNEKNKENLEVHNLFDFRFTQERSSHKYQLEIERVYSQLQTIECNIALALIETTMQNADAGYDIEGFLDYQLSYSKVTNKKFLDTLESLIQFGLSVWNKSGIVPITYKGKRVDKWITDKRKEVEGQLTKGITYEPIILGDKCKKNEIPTFFFRLLEEHKINTSKENLKKILIEILRDQNGEKMNRSYLNDIFNKSKPEARSKKI